MRSAMTGMVVVAALSLATSTTASDPQFVDGGFDGNTVWSYGPIGEEADFFIDSTGGKIGASGGGGQTSGGVDGLVEGELAFEVTVGSAAAAPNGPTTVTVTEVGYAFFNTEKFDGLHWYGGISMDASLEQTKLQIAESTCYFIRTNQPGMVNLPPVEGEITDKAISAGLYHFATGFAISAVHDPPHNSDPGPHFKDNYWQLVLAAPGDLTGSSTVDVLDLLVMLESWGTCAEITNCLADINGDGVVDVEDLALLLENWGVVSCVDD